MISRFRYYFHYKQVTVKIMQYVVEVASLFPSYINLSLKLKVHAWLAARYTLCLGKEKREM